jgi:hypothetical protein
MSLREEPPLERPASHSIPRATSTSRREETFQHRICSPDQDQETPVAAYVLTRVVPTLQYIGWIPSWSGPCLPPGF